MFKMKNTGARTTSHSGILIVNFEVVLASLLLTLNMSDNLLLFQLLILNIYQLNGTEREIQNKMG